MSSRSILQRARTTTRHLVAPSSSRNISCSSVRLDDPTTPSPFHPKPHLRPEALQGVLRYSTSSSSSSLPTSSSHAYSTKSSRPADPPTKPSPESLLDTSRSHKHDDSKRKEQIKYDQDHDVRLHHEHLAPVAPKLPPRRRPNYQAAGFGLSGDYGRKPQPGSIAGRQGGKKRTTDRSDKKAVGSAEDKEEPASPDLPAQPTPHTSAFTRHDPNVQVLGTGTGGNVQMSSSTGGSGGAGEVLGVQGSEVRRMDEGEKDAVDGNEAEACYVVSRTIASV